MSELTKLERNFLKFHANNPQVYELVKRFTFEVLDSGRTRLSTKLLIERIRWELNVTLKATDEFKINNNHTAYYARKFIQDYPQHATVFEMRVTKGQKRFGTDAQL